MVEFVQREPKRLVIHAVAVVILDAVGTNVIENIMYGALDKGHTGTLMQYLHIQKNVYQKGPDGILIRQRTTIEQASSRWVKS